MLPFSRSYYSGAIHTVSLVHVCHAYACSLCVLMCVHSLVRSTYRRLLATLIRRAHRLAGTPRICPRRTVYSALQGVPVKIYPILRTHVIGHKTESHGEIIPLPYTCGVPVETADSDEKSLLMFSFI